MKNIGLLFVLVLPSLLVAQDKGGNRFPREGRVTADRVNLRCGPGTNFRSFLTLDKGSKLTVIGEKKEWYAVIPPAGIFFFIHRRYVSKGRKLVGGYEGEVLGNNVNVRSGIGDRDRVMGQLNRGDRVTIVGEKEQWFKIKPPEGMCVWIAAKYVKLEQKVGGKKPKEENGRKVVRTAKKTDREETLEKEVEELRRRVEKLLAELNVKESELRKIREERESWERRYERIKKKLEDADRKEKELREKYERRIKEILEREPGRVRPTRYTAVGVIYDFGALVVDRPGGATHKLKETEDGPVKYYLKPARSEIKLDDYLFKRVGIIGKIEEIGGLEEKLLIVEKIEILTE